MPDDLQNLWQSQQPDPFRISLEKVHAQALKLQRRVRFRNLREYLGSAFVIVFFTWMTFTLGDPIRRAGSVLLVAGAVYIAWHLHKWGSSREVTGNCLEFHRRELERQRDLLRSIWRWYLGPMIPGLLAICVAGLRDKRGAWHTWFVIAYVAFCAVGFYFVSRLNQRAARCLQRQIDELDRLTK